MQAQQQGDVCNSDRVAILAAADTPRSGFGRVKDHGPGRSRMIAWRSCSNVVDGLTA